MHAIETRTKAIAVQSISASFVDDDDILEYSTDPELIFERFENLVDIVIDGGPGHNIASTIVLCEAEEFEVIRQGLGDLNLFL
jgi:tRNA A37 threonylcarbamoyladenosine synthetase subunit TsaC/SUA5/YrdC